MKIEEYELDFSQTASDIADLDIKQWREKYPLDYFKMAALINYVDKTLPVKDAYISAFKILYTATRRYIPDLLYKYVSLSNDKASNEKRFSTLQNRTLYLSKVEGFNDPFDGKAFYYDPDRFQTFNWLRPYNGRIIDDFSSYIRIVALTENDVNSLPMWAHYANNHSGFCIAYNMKDNPDLYSTIYQVQYTEQRLDITTFLERHASTLENLNQNEGEKLIRSISLPIVHMSMLLSCIKNSSWSYEKEYRCIASTRTEGMPYMEANASEIYIGMNCDHEHVKRLLEIGYTLKIPVYKMTFDEVSPDYKFSVKPVLMSK